MKSISNMMKFFESYRKKLLIIAILVLIGELSQILVPLGTKYLVEHINMVSYKEGMQLLMLIGILYIATFTIRAIADYVDAIGTSFVWDDAKQKVHVMVFDKFLSLSSSWHDDNKTGEIISLIDRDVEASCEILVALPTTILRNILGIVIGISLFLYIDPMLMLMISPILILTMFFQLFISPMLKKTQKKWRAMQRNYIALISDLLFGHQTIIGFGKEAHERTKIFDAYQNIRSIAMKKYREGFLNKEGMRLLVSLFYDTTILIGAYRVITHKEGLVSFLMFYMYAHWIVNPMADLASYVRYFHESMEAFERVYDFLHLEETIKTPECPTLLSNPKGKVTFSHVSFGYNEQMVFQDINFNIYPGEYVALIGLSGVGKSTIGKLISRCYDAIQGAILFDDVNIKDMSLEQLRHLVGTVSQEIYLFNGTIVDNIRYGKLDATREEIIEASKLANAHDFIMETTDGYQSEIGEHGVKLSGGQRQRLAIARLLLANPSVMVFDEATSALDEISQKEIRNALNRIIGRKTMIVIAHRLSTIKNADRILYLTKHGIVEEGTHEELIQKNGYYAKLYFAEN